MQCKSTKGDGVVGTRFVPLTGRWRSKVWLKRRPVFKRDFLGGGRGYCGRCLGPSRESNQGQGGWVRRVLKRVPAELLGSTGTVTLVKNPSTGTLASCQVCCGLDNNA
jgi:hypothetical protein